jgi:hypothetical protein
MDFKNLYLMVENACKTILPYAEFLERATGERLQIIARATPL